LFIGGIGFGTLAGIHLGNPGVAGSIEGDDPRETARILRVANGMEALGIVGGVLAISGATLAAVGGVLLRKEKRRSRLAQVLVAPGFGSLSLVGRF